MCRNIMFQCHILSRILELVRNKRKLEIALGLILNMDTKIVNVKLGGDQVEVYLTLFIFV